MFELLFLAWFTTRQARRYEAPIYQRAYLWASGRSPRRPHTTATPIASETPAERMQRERYERLTRR